MRRSGSTVCRKRDFPEWIITIVTGIIFLVLQAISARAENPDPQVLSGTVNQAPFPGVSLVDPAIPATKTRNPDPGREDRKHRSLPSTSPERKESGSPGIPEQTSGTSQPSLGNLFELKRQEALLRREISIKKLKDQLKGPRAKKVFDTGAKGSPMTLLGAGIEGKRYAILSWPDGRRIRVRQGETLPDGARVIRIDGSGVSVRKRGSVVTYPYGDAPGKYSGGGYPPFPSRGASFQGPSFSLQGADSSGTPLSGFMPPPPPSSAGGNP